MLFQHGVIPTTVTQRCSLTPLTSQTHFSSVFPFPVALSTKTCLTRKHYSTESKCFLKAGEWERSEKILFFFFFFPIFFSPSLMCAVVDHVECTSIWWKVASASCCVPFLKEKLVFVLFFFRVGGRGRFHLWTRPQLLPSRVAPSTHIVLRLLIQSSCL